MMLIVIYKSHYINLSHLFLNSNCERKKWAEDARAYNELIGSWHAIVAASHESGHRVGQEELSLDI